MSGTWAGMTPEEIGEATRREWLEQVAQAEAEGRTLPHISRAKREDYPHLRFTGWTFQVRDGAPAEVVAPADAGAGVDVEGRALLRGLRRGADGAPVLLLQTADGALWGLRRADGTPWPEELDAWSVKTEKPELDVVAWPVPDAGPAAVLDVPAAGGHTWTVRTGDLEGERG